MLVAGLVIHYLDQYPLLILRNVHAVNSAPQSHPFLPGQ